MTSFASTMKRQLTLNSFMNNHEIAGFNVVKTWWTQIQWLWKLKHLKINVIRTPHPLRDDFGPGLPLLFKLHEIFLVAFLKNRQNCCHQMSDFTAKMHQSRFRLGKPAELTAPPDTVARFKGAQFSVNLFNVDSRRVVSSR